LASIFLYKSTFWFYLYTFVGGYFYLVLGAIST